MNLELRRLRVVMAPAADDPKEAWGVLNPASARSAEGALYLFPRLVAEGNYSRIGIVRVCFDAAGDPNSVERLGVALEPQEPYERMLRGQGGVEDPRITFIPLLGRYVMAYTALGPLGPRIALAVSKDLFSWERLGPLHFEPTCQVDLTRFGNKDCVVIPTPVRDRERQWSFGMLHRPTFLVYNPNGTVRRMVPACAAGEPRPSIWISYASLERTQADIRHLVNVHDNDVVAAPHEPWEGEKIGAGSPPILTDQGWLLYYHGVTEVKTVPGQPRAVCYRAGAMVLDREDPRSVLYRTSQPVLSPTEPAELVGVVPNVVFPTAVDVRGQRVDVYYGAADTRVAVATGNIPPPVLLAPSTPGPATDEAIR
jgi:beta-1,2-mannobiose phosphorylase / 1,2-beta-oligomannan phosphorylase